MERRASSPVRPKLGRATHSQSFPRTSLLHIRQIVEAQAFSIFQLENYAGTNVSPPRPQALHLPGLHGNRNLAKSW